MEGNKIEVIQDFNNEWVERYRRVSPHDSLRKSSHARRRVIWSIIWTRSRYGNQKLNYSTIVLSFFMDILDTELAQANVVPLVEVLASEED